MERLDQLFSSVIRKVLFHTLPHIEATRFSFKKTFSITTFSLLYHKIWNHITPKREILDLKTFLVHNTTSNNTLRLHRRKFYAINVSENYSCCHGSILFSKNKKFSLVFNFQPFSASHDLHLKHNSMILLLSGTTRRYHRQSTTIINKRLNLYSFCFERE